LKFFLIGLLGMIAVNSSMAGPSNFGSIAIGGDYSSSVSENSGDNFVKYDLANVVRLQPIVVQKVYSVVRQSCSVVEDLSSTNNPPVVGGVVGTSPPKTIQRCVSYNDREYKSVIIGYDVTFEYYGQIRTVQMENDPGNTIRIKAVTSVYVVQ